MIRFSKNMLPPKVSIIILQFNNSEDTIKCLRFVKKLDYPNFEVIIVDNNSNSPHLENTENYLKSQSIHNSYFIIHTSSNTGYAGGNNIGIKKGLENGTDYVLILNNDTEVPANLLEKLIRAAESDDPFDNTQGHTERSRMYEKIGIVGPLIKETRDKEQETSKIVCGGKIRWLHPELKHIESGIRNQESGSHNSLFILHNSEYVPGTCMLISKQTIEKIGLLPEEYFLYFEDADYCLKAHKMGLKCIITPETTINHKEHGSTAKIGSPLVLRYHFRNFLYFNRKNGPFWAKTLLYPWSLWIIGKQVVKLVLDIHKEQSRAILKGVSDFYKGEMGKI